jgi:hypothetical protein
MTTIPETSLAGATRRPLWLVPVLLFRRSMFVKSVHFKASASD